MNSTGARPIWKTLLAFAIIYFVWGSTFLAIRVGVHEVPPVLFAAMRFIPAGGLLLIWSLLKGDRLPSGREWLSVTLIGFLIFVADYGLLFWAETRVPSGIAAVMMATIPAFIAIAEVLFLGTQKLTLRLVAALLIGFAGVGVLTLRAQSLGGPALSLLGAIALVVASLNWSIASVITRKLPLPESKTISSSTQMLSGGILLTALAAALGDFKGFSPSAVSPQAWFALVYLIVFGSIIGFTAYVWLIHHESPTKVGTYAYVNPVVAVLIGHWLGREELGLRVAVGTALVLASVVVITTTRRRSSMEDAPAAGRLDGEEETA